MAEGQSMTVADVVAKTTMDGRVEDFVREAVALVEMRSCWKQAKMSLAFASGARAFARGGRQPR